MKTLENFAVMLLDEGKGCPIIFLLELCLMYHLTIYLASPPISSWSSDIGHLSRLQMETNYHG